MLLETSNNASMVNLNSFGTHEKSTLLQLHHQSKIIEQFGSHPCTVYEKNRHQSPEL